MSGASTHTMTDTTDNQWMQFYDQHPLMEGFISDAAAVTTLSSPSTMMSPSNSYTGPKAFNMSKPIRRRSRASKRSPTTLLNANTANFRALVQQFTGCPSKTTMSFGVPKGPITLNFQQGRRQVQFHRNTTGSTLNGSYNNNSNSLQVHQQQADHQGGILLQQQQQQQQLVQGYQNQRGASSDYSSSHFLSTSSGNYSSKPSMDLSDGLLVDHNFSLHDLLQ